ncbi:TolC family protein [Aquabacterium sp.]|uniref:TolC family protein n=1 Tax=Aquabacterium sp. TaxID=1872578 RepID=UPI002BC2E391|nr:TolC family protein [Aquabacterium sp.]HSW04626.1 TolC family protein [Aquabacterium sp.]
MVPVSMPPLACLVLAGCMLFSAASHGQAALTLDQALRAAQDRSHQLAALHAAAAAAREMAVAAGQRPDPTLRVGLNNLPVDGPDRFSVTRDFMTMRSVAAMQELTGRDKLSARSARFEREAEAAEAARAQALATLRRETAMAWLDRHFQEQMLDLLRALRAEAGLQIEAAEAAYRGGRGGQADVFAARSAVALIDDRLRQTEGQLAVAKTRLARWVGDEARQALGAAPSLAAIRLDEGRVESQLAQQPEIVMLLKQEEIARAEADIAQRNKRPDWSVELMLSQRGPAYSNMVSVNVSLPLPVDPKNRQDRELAARLARVEQARAQREEATRAHGAEIRGWLQAWRSDRNRLAHYDGSLIPLAAERTRAALAAYRGGGGPLAAVLEARRIEIDTRLDRLRLEMDAAALWARLETLVPPGHDTAAPQRPAQPTEQ